MINEVADSNSSKSSSVKLRHQSQAAQYDVVDIVLNRPLKIWLDFDKFQGQLGGRTITWLKDIDPQLNCKFQVELAEAETLAGRAVQAVLNFIAGSEISHTQITGTEHSLTQLMNTVKSSNSKDDLITNLAWIAFAEGSYGKIHNDQEYHNLLGCILDDWANRYGGDLEWMMKAVGTLPQYAIASINKAKQLECERRPSTETSNLLGNWSIKTVQSHDITQRAQKNQFWTDTSFRQAVADGRKDFTGENLSYLDLCGMKLRGFILRKTDLSYTRFCGADLQGSDLGGALVSHTDFGGANLNRAKMQGVSGEGINLAGARLCGGDLSDSLLHKARMVGADISDANFSRTDMRDANLKGAKQQGTKLDGSILSDGHIFQIKQSIQIDHQDDPSQVIEFESLKTLLEEKSRYGSLLSVLEQPMKDWFSGTNDKLLALLAIELKYKKDRQGKVSIDDRSFANAEQQFHGFILDWLIMNNNADWGAAQKWAETSPVSIVHCLKQHYLQPSRQRLSHIANLVEALLRVRVETSHDFLIQPSMLREVLRDVIALLDLSDCDLEQLLSVLRNDVGCIYAPLGKLLDDSTGKMRESFVHMMGSYYDDLCAGKENFLESEQEATYRDAFLDKARKFQREQGLSRSELLGLLKDIPGRRRIALPEWLDWFAAWQDVPSFSVVPMLQAYMDKPLSIWYPTALAFVLRNTNKKGELLRSHSPIDNFAWWVTECMLHADLNRKKLQNETSGRLKKNLKELFKGEEPEDLSTLLKTKDGPMVLAQVLRNIDLYIDEHQPMMLRAFLRDFFRLCKFPFDSVHEELLTNIDQQLLEINKHCDGLRQASIPTTATINRLARYLDDIQKVSHDERLSILYKLIVGIEKDYSLSKSEVYVLIDEVRTRLENNQLPGETWQWRWLKPLLIPLRQRFLATKKPSECIVF